MPPLIDVSDQVAAALPMKPAFESRETAYTVSELPAERVCAGTTTPDPSEAVSTRTCVATGTYGLTVPDLEVVRGRIRGVDVVDVPSPGSAGAAPIDDTKRNRRSWRHVLQCRYSREINRDGE